MAVSPASDRVTSRGDVASLWFFMVAGLAFAVYTTVHAVLRVIHVLGPGDVRVFATFDATMGTAPVGPDGAPVPVELVDAYLLAPELPVASIGALVAEQIVIVAAVWTVIISLLVLVWRIRRGRLFSRGNTALVATAAIATLAGAALAPFFANMGANGAFAWLSDRTFDNALLRVDLVPFFAIAFVGAIATTAFSVGDRLQRDTTGLV